MPLPFCYLLDSQKLISLGGWDIALVAIYFVAVLAIGFYLKGHAETGEKHRFPTAAYKRVMQKAGLVLARGGFLEQIQHRTVLRAAPGLATCAPPDDSTSAKLKAHR